MARDILEQPELADDIKFSSNAARVANRAELVKIISNKLTQHDQHFWLQKFHGLG